MTLVTRMAGGTAIGAAMLIGLSAPSAQAGYVVDLTQQRGDVVATGSGSIDLTGLSFLEEAESPASGMWPAEGLIVTGPTSEVVFDLYQEASAGPESFGSGGATTGSSGAGDGVAIVGGGEFIDVPHGYVSGARLSDTSTYDGATLASLGATPGRYEWTWGSGANQNFTLVIGAAVPESSTWAMMLLGFAGLCFAGYRARAAASSNLWVPW
jgi:hypothetical protein